MENHLPKNITPTQYYIDILSKCQKKTLTTENNFLWYLRFYSTWSYFFLRKSSHFNHYSEDFISSHLKFPNFFLCDNVNVNVRSKTRRNQRFHQLWLQDRRKEQKKTVIISHIREGFFFFLYDMVVSNICIIFMSMYERWWLWNWILDNGGYTLKFCTMNCLKTKKKNKIKTDMNFFFIFVCLINLKAFLLFRCFHLLLRIRLLFYFFSNLGFVFHIF